MVSTANFTNEQLVAKLLENSNKYPQLSDFIKDGNVINACKTVRSVTGSVDACPIPPLTGGDAPSYVQSGQCIVDPTTQVCEPVLETVTYIFEADESSSRLRIDPPNPSDPSSTTLTMRSSKHIIFSNQNSRSTEQNLKSQLTFLRNGEQFASQGAAITPSDEKTFPLESDLLIKKDEKFIGINVRVQPEGGEAESNIQAIINLFKF